MTDLVERLRKYHADFTDDELAAEAADEIARLRAALKQISRLQPDMTPVEAADYYLGTARAALQVTP